ncbi:HAD-IA family hydrolase [Actinomyces slackii]|uniref:?-D-glucose-1-phosphatase n=1 Tax=Actinomyces slackii TaxID=52774 RepID=A0A448K989_9ACTO|nr:HAD-IA family hydrolase [Actinomyces slackii]VEG73427.1 ?-D-glucose-1-phosphatase [Actinomyces slackii]
MSDDQPIVPASASPIRAVLLDADGVLQIIGTPWVEALSQVGGEAFAHALLNGEEDAQTGRESLMALLERMVERFEVATPAQEILSLWHRAEPDPLAWQVARDLRAADYITVLATNQQPERRDWMRGVVGYDGLCDMSAYSCELGVAKPDPAYFLRVLELAGVRADEALFVDDNAANVSTARDLGIRTVHHPADAGGELLRKEIIEALA